jgi:glutamine amidotransferase
MDGKTVTIVDYGLGNLYSIRRAVEYLGGSAVIAEEPSLVAEAKRLILPGVGAFGKGMDNLIKMGLVDILKDFAASGRPMLGICLGMQLLMDESEELGRRKGLGIIRGKVVRLSGDSASVPCKIPHIGWNTVSRARPSGCWDGTILNGLPEGCFMYFVHSYAPAPSDSGDTISVTEYGGKVFSSAIQKGSVCGCQFHPERSASGGLMVLDNFIKRVPEPGGTGAGDRSDYDRKVINR